MKNLFMLLVSLLFTACQPENLSSEPTKDEPGPIAGYLALGDSYTIGQSVPETDRWPVILADSLSHYGLFEVEPKIIAKTGWTTDELDAAINQAGIRDTFSLVSLLIGVNNQYRGRPVEEFRLQFRNLLQRAIGFAGGKVQNVFVVSIPDWGVSPFAANMDRDRIAGEIDSFNLVKKEETLKMNVTFVDIAEISRMALNQPEFIASDGLHFSGAMHRLWVSEILKSYFNQ